jgi:hypothetical protein
MDAEKGWLQKREFERVSNSLKVCFYPVDSASAQKTIESDDYKDTTVEKIMTGNTQSSLVQAITDDISKGGLSIISEKEISVGQYLIIDLFLPKLSKPVKLLTEVRNIEKAGATYKAGLKTVSVSKSDLRRIENHIAASKFKPG